MKQMFNRFYSQDGKAGTERSMERKKLKRQPTIQSSEMDMSDISQNSLLCGMQQFDKAVQNMEETILVPSRLMDMSMEGDSEKRKAVPALLRSSDAYDVYRLLKSVRSQVRQGGMGQAEETTTPKLQRTPTMMSSQSLSSLSSDSSSGGGWRASEDSGHESANDQENDGEDKCEAVRAEFDAHLSGLGKCLAQMSEAASFLSSRYEQQLDSGF